MIFIKKIRSFIEGIALSKSQSFVIFLVILALLSFYMMYVFMPEDKLYLGYDIYFHLRRLDALMAALQSGSYPIYIDYDAAAGFGYITKWFYPDFMLVPFAMIGNQTNIFFAYRLMILFFTLVCGIATYKTTESVLNNSFIAFVTALLYTFSLYRLHNFFYRAALGEGIAMTFIPIILWGLYLIVKGNYKKWYIIAFGFSFLLMTHLLTSAMMFIVVVVFSLFCYKDLKSEPQRLKYLIIAGIVTFFVSAGYILPLLEQLFSNDFYFNSPDPSTWMEVTGQSWFQTLRALFNGFSFGEDDQRPSIGILLTFAIVIRMFIYKKDIKDIRLKYMDYVAIIGVVLVFMATKYFPWGIYPFRFLNFIQFPSRLYEFSSYLFAIAGAFYIHILLQNNLRKILALSFILLATAGILTINGQVFQKPDKLTNSERFTLIPNPKNFYHLTAVEYVPLKFPEMPDSKFPSVIYMGERSGKIENKNTETSISNYTRKKDITTFGVVATIADTVELPLFYYKGYAATLNSHPISVEESKIGLVQIPIASCSGEVKVWYEGTFIQKWSISVTAISFILLCFYSIFHSLKHRNSKECDEVST